MALSRSTDAPHVIRLRGPWEGREWGMENPERGSGEAVDQKPSRVKVPLSLNDWLPDDFRGKVSLDRAFGLPTNLDDRQQVQLVLQTQQLNVVAASLNDVDLPTCSPTVAANGDTGVEAHLLRYDVSAHLQTRNRLRLVFDVDAESEGVLSDAWIEIRG